MTSPVTGSTPPPLVPPPTLTASATGLPSAPRRSSERHLSADEAAYLIDRSAEAARLAAVIIGATSRFVVLHGQPASGKSTLVRKWLIPALRASSGSAGRRVYYGECKPTVPHVVAEEHSTATLDEAMSHDAIVVIDAFDRVLEAPREDRKRELDALFAGIGGAKGAATLVVVVDVRQLTTVYSLTAYNPAVGSAIEGIRGVEFAEGLTRLAMRRRDDGAVRYTPEALAKLEHEATVLHLDCTFDFLKLVHARFRSVLADTRGDVVDAAQCEMVGGLEGILRDHVDGCIDTVEENQPGRAGLAHGVLLAVHEVVSRGTTLDIVALSRRYEVPVAVVNDVLAILAAPDGPIVGRADAPLGLQPPQISVILEADSTALQSKAERARRVIEEALRSWRALGTPMPAIRLAEIHAQRHELELDAELTRFLAQSALRVQAAQAAELEDAAAYWLARVPDEDAVDLLLAGLFDGDAGVRQRAAHALAHWPGPRVRDRLCVLALSDDALPVRTAAVDSLMTMADEGLLGQLRSEATNAKSANRVNAVYALRLFPQEGVTELLRGFVADIETPLAVRKEAVRALAAIAMPASVDALVDIALNDADGDDRHAAAAALASLPTPELNRRLLDQLRWPRPIGRIVGIGVFLAWLLFVGVSLAWVVAGAMADKIGWLLLGLAAFTIGTGALVRRVASGRIRRRSAVGLLSLALFTVCTVAVIPFFHGLAHWMIKRRPRALLLFCVELGSIALMGLAYSVRNLEVVWAAYFTLAVVVFAGSYLYDTLVVMLRTFVLPRQLTREERRSAILRRVMGNPVMTATVLEAAGGPDRSDRRRARSLVRRYGQHMAASVLVDELPAVTVEQRVPMRDALSRAKDDTAVARLGELWISSSAQTRRLIGRILEARPTERAAATLGRLAQGEGLPLKVRAWIAGVRYRLSVWPLSARLVAVTLLPAVAILIYQGVQIVRNPEWGMILRLRGLGVEEQAKVKVVDLLVEQYPATAEPEIRRLFKDGRKNAIGPLHAAVTRGLVHLADSSHASNRMETYRQLAAELPRFNQLLSDTADASFDLGASVLGAMAGSLDTTLANHALRLLVAAADSTGRARSVKASRLDTLAAVIARLDYDRALPVLGGMFQAFDAGRIRADQKVTHLLRMRIAEAADAAYAKLPDSGAVDQKIQLRDALRKAMPGLRTGLVAVLEADIEATKRCTGAAAAFCDALRLIALHPEIESGYRDLEGHLSADSQFVRADSAFTALSEAHPDAVWPRKILSEIEHENLAATDPRYFKKSYEDAQIVRRLPAFRAMATDQMADYRRIEEDFAEVALSAGEHADVQALARRVLRADSLSASDSLNMNLFPYMASVMARDADSATVRLARLTAVIVSLPAGFNNQWEYPGTRAFIRNSDLAPALKTALLDLCKEGAWYGRADARRVIQENREALRLVGAR